LVRLFWRSLEWVTCQYLWVVSHVGHGMVLGYIAERAVTPAGDVSWVVVEDLSFELHVEATTFLAALRARDLSPNTD
jgi:hypothetical protein